MTTVHDDLPHPVPAFAHLRYKENYFFILLAPESDAFGVIHFNHEPGFDRARYTANLEIAGKTIRYANTTAFPALYEYARAIGDDALTLQFTEPHKRFDLSLVTGEINLKLAFSKRRDTYDYAASRTCGNPAATFQDVMTMGLNLPYNHQQQALDAIGEARFVNGATLAIKGSGYRDHSWVMRCDAGVLSHTWCGYNFLSRSFGIKTIATTARPDLIAKEGYVADAQGVRALRAIEVRSEGAMADGLCERLVHEVVDVFGVRHTIIADIAKRHAHVPLVSEAPSGQASYQIVENFTPLHHLESGETGIGLVELGRHATGGGRTA